MQEFNPSLDQQIACVTREIALRERVYPKWIETQRMTRQKADHEIDCMKAVLGVLMAHKAMSGPKVR
jgi:hypothetical protein